MRVDQGWEYESRERMVYNGACKMGRAAVGLLRAPRRRLKAALVAWSSASASSSSGGAVVSKIVSGTDWD